MEQYKILYPGEGVNFDKNLLCYNSFKYNKNNKNESLTCLKTMKIFYDSENNISQKIPIITSGNFYFPLVGDTVIGIITQKTFEYYKVDIGSSKEAVLLSTSFEGATKKTKPNLNIGDIVFTRIESDNKYSNPSVSCKSAENSKGWATGESMFGELKGGFLFNIPRIKAWNLIKDINIRNEIKNYVDFEMTIGLNGRIWIKSERPENVIIIFDCIKYALENNKEKYKKYINDKLNLLLNK